MIYNLSQLHLKSQSLKLRRKLNLKVRRPKMSDLLSDFEPSKGEDLLIFVFH
jgi:hypothetical protein|tara:strand:+ start:1250 stop:1405 length:156 start_codon:yes stop_codon:yes gene_type:complete